MVVMGYYKNANTTKSDKQKQGENTITNCTDAGKEVLLCKPRSEHLST